MQKNKSANGIKGKSDFFRFIGVASTVGINMVVSTFVGFAIGYWLLDRYLDTLPWFTIIFTIAGIATGFLQLFRIAKKAEEREDEE